MAHRPTYVVGTHQYMMSQVVESIKSLNKNACVRALDPNKRLFTVELDETDNWCAMGHIANIDGVESLRCIKLADAEYLPGHFEISKFSLA